MLPPNLGRYKNLLTFSSTIVSQAAGGKTVVVTESGWPTQGGNNGVAVARQQNHETAIQSLKTAFGGGTNLILYGMYNDLWKKDGPTTFGAEKYWGVSELVLPFLDAFAAPFGCPNDEIWFSLWQASSRGIDADMVSFSQIYGNAPS